MTKVAIKPNAERADKIHGERWRDVIFLRDGRSCVAPRDFPSEEAATLVGRRNAERCAQEPRSLFVVHGAGFYFLGSQYSHFIPIPLEGA